MGDELPSSVTEDWVDLIKEYNPYNEQEEKDKEVILSYIATFPDILHRTNEMVHITSSAFAVNKTRDKVLMVHHNIYNSWSWTGGHADGEGDLLTVALQELREETGVEKPQPIMPQLLSIDLLPVIGHHKNGKYVAAHLHVSLAFFVEVDEEELLLVKEDENSGVQWIPMDEMVIYSNEPHMQQVYGKIIAKIKKGDL